MVFAHLASISCLRRNYIPFQCEGDSLQLRDFALRTGFINDLNKCRVWLSFRSHVGNSDLSYMMPKPDTIWNAHSEAYCLTSNPIAGRDSGKSHRLKLSIRERRQEWPSAKQKKRRIWGKRPGMVYYSHPALEEKVGFITLSCLRISWKPLQSLLATQNGSFSTYFCSPDLA